MAAGGEPTDEVDRALYTLFKAYDLDESGVLTRREFIQIEMRIAFEIGEVFDEEAESAKFTVADTDNSGTLDFPEFQGRQLRVFNEMGWTKAEMMETLAIHTKKCLTERMKMGPRYHAGIRQQLKRIFSLYDISGDGVCNPEEWIAAHTVVALEISDDIDEEWISEGAFAIADTNGDGILQLSEFLEWSYKLFEGAVKQRTTELLATLERVVGALEKQRETPPQCTPELKIYLQADEKIPFMPPRLAWQDAGEEKWSEAGAIKLPMNLSTVDQVSAIIRLTLQLPSDNVISIFYQGPSTDGSGDRIVKLMCGERPGEGNVKEALEYFCKPSGSDRLYIKNVRKKSTKLTRQQRAFLEDRDIILAKKHPDPDQIEWALDWETQVTGPGCINIKGFGVPQNPPWVLIPGDTFAVEVPQTDDMGAYTYVATAWMDGIEVLSQPVDHDVVIKMKKPKKGETAVEPDKLVKLDFVAQKVGTCVLFVEVSWEDQEEKLCGANSMELPCAANSIARVGPLSVTVEACRPPPGPKDKPPLPVNWWNGKAWAKKKGAAKK